MDGDDGILMNDGWYGDFQNEVGTGGRGEREMSFMVCAALVVETIVQNNLFNSVLGGIFLFFFIEIECFSFEVFKYEVVLFIYIYITNII